MATCNGEAYLSRQIASIASQSLPPSRLIIRDDASTDSTPELLRSLQKYPPFDIEILVEIGEQRLGPRENFNRALLWLQKIGPSPVILLSDQDDLWYPDKIRKSLLCLDRLQQRFGEMTPLLVFSDLDLVDLQEKSLGQTFFQRQHLNPFHHQWQQLVLQNVITGCSAAFNRACLDRALPIPAQARLHDGWLGLVAAAFGVIEYLPEPLLAYRQHSQNVLGADPFRKQSLLHWFSNFRHGRVAERYVNPALDQAIVLLKRYGSEYPHLEKSLPHELLQQLKAPQLWIRAMAGLRLPLAKQGIGRRILWWVCLLWPRRRRLSCAAEDFRPYRLQSAAVSSLPPRRVLHAIANVQTGGSTRLVVDLVEGLADVVHQRVLTSFQPEPEEYVGLDTQELTGVPQLRCVREAIQTFDPQLIHVHYWGGCDRRWYRQVFRAAAQLGLPVVQNVNTPVCPYDSPAVQANVYVSNYVQHIFGKGDPLAHVIHPGSNFELFSKPLRPESGDVAGMVYRLEPDKLDSTAIDVMLAIVRLRPNSRCLIVGGGSLLESMLAKVAAAGLANRFQFTDYVAYEDLPGYYAQMSVFVAPVRQESFGQVTPFAMSMGLPVVAYRTGALPELLVDEALLAPVGDSGALARLVVDLLDQPERRKQIGERNRQRAHSLYSVQAMLASYRSLYASLGLFL